MATQTLLTLQGIGVPDFSARGLTQTLEPIEESHDYRRTINAVLIDLSDAAFDKYTSTITCSDMTVPALDGVFPGQTVEVGCVLELCYKAPLIPETVDGENANKPVVTGSIRTANGFVYYRPKLTMMVTEFSQQKDEWGAVIGWQLELSEV